MMLGIAAFSALIFIIAIHIIIAKFIYDKVRFDCGNFYGVMWAIASTSSIISFFSWLCTK